MTVIHHDAVAKGTVCKYPEVWTPVVVWVRCMECEQAFLGVHATRSQLAGGR